MMVMTPSSDLPFHAAKDDPGQLLQDKFESEVEKVYKKYQAMADALNVKLRKPSFDSGWWIVAKRCMFLVLLVMLFAASSGVVTTTKFGGG